MQFSFGEFVLDASTRELTRAGEVVSVEPQVFDLIAFLIEQRGRVVSREDIIDAVWSGRIVSDSAVSSRIKSARQALGDDGRAQALIKTVHGKGFRFVANVRLLEQEEDETAVGNNADLLAGKGAPPPSSSPSVDASPKGSVAVLGAIAVLTIAIIALFLAFRPTGSENNGVRVAVLPVTNATGVAEYDWTELGLMSLAAYSLENRSGEAVVSPRAVLAAASKWAASQEGEIGVSDEIVERLRRAYGASHIVAARLRGDARELTLEFQVVSPRGVATLRSISGDDPSKLANRMTREVLATLPRSGERPAVRHDVSDDPFIAEAYARGRALQLRGRAEESRDLFKVASEQDPANLWLRYEYAISARMAGDMDESETVLTALLPEAKTKGDTRAQLGVLNGLGQIQARRGDRETAIATYQTALEIADEKRDFKSAGVILTNLGIEERKRKNYETAELHLGRALTMFDAAGYEAPPGSLLNSLALLKIRTGDLLAGEAYLERALDTFELTDAERAVAVVLRNLGDISEAFGRWRQADERLSRSLAMRRALEDRRGELSSLDALAGLRLRQGRFDDASNFANALQQLAESENDQRKRAQAEIHLGEIARRRGDDARARSHFDAARTLYRQIESEANLRGVEARLLVVSRDSRESEETITRLQEIAAWAQAENNQGLVKDVSEILAQESLRRDDRETAIAALQAAVAAARAMPRPSEEARISARLGQLHLDADDLETASGLLGVAQELHADHFEVLRLAAKIAELSGQTQHALALERDARAAAGDNWLSVTRPMR